MVAGLTGDDEQHGNSGGDHAQLGDQAAVHGLVGGDVAEGEAEAGAHSAAHGLGHGQQHQHQGQLAGDDGDHLTAEAHAGIGRAGGRAAQDDGHGRDQQQVEDDDHIRHAGEGAEGEHGDEQLDHHQRRQTHQRRHEEGGLGGRGGDDGLLAAELEEVIEGLENGGTHAFLHLGHQFSVDAAEQHTGQEAEQEAGEDEHIAQILQGTDNNCHDSHLLKERSG